MVKNIRLINPNMVRVGSYFYSFNEETDVMIQKADDGTLAFSYPLDTSITQQISSIEHDGESFWTMENIDGTASNGFRIRRWVIENFVMVLQNTFTFATDATDTFEAKAFTLEHYDGTVAAGATEATSTSNLSFVNSTVFDLLTPGTRLFFGPSSKAGFVGETETATVGSTSGVNQVSVSSPFTNGYAVGDKVSFSKNIWVLNQHYLKTTDAGGLYKMLSLDGSILSRTSGGAFKDVNAATFHELDSFTGSLTTFNKPYLVFIRTTNLLFVNINDSNLTIELSAVQNNLSIDTATVYDVEDMGIEGDTIYRLQTNFNINGTESTDAFNYQLATFKPFPTAIAISADPAILAADSGVSTSLITATVTDQYALAFVKTPAATITFGTSGGGTGSGVSPAGPTALDTAGQATTTYTTGDTAGLVTITATVSI